MFGSGWCINNGWLAYYNNATDLSGDFMLKFYDNGNLAISKERYN